MQKLLPLIVLAAFWLAPDAVDPVVIRNVTVIDGTGAKARSGQTVVVSGGKIVSVGSRGKTPAGATMLDGSGKFLIPGLWDMHVHMTSTPGFTELYLANGVTGVRDMFSYPEEINPLREEIRSGNRRGPRIISAGRILDGPKPIWPRSVAVNTVEAAREAVHTVKAEGSDFVKVYSLLPRDAYLAILKESAREGLPVSGHVPDSVTAREASNAGQKCIEHLSRVMAGCAPNLKRPDPLPDGTPDYQRLAAYTRQIQESYDDNLASELFRAFKKNGTWHCPTLTVNRSISLLDGTEITTDSRMKYFPKWLRELWDPKNDFRFKSYTPPMWENWKRNYRLSRDIVGKMNRAGVRILAGTDVGNPYCMPGFSIHDELSLMVESGLTPMEALQTATRNPAQFLGIEKECGTIGRGKRADLVLLDANPLDDIRNTARIRAVIVGGRVMERRALDEILKTAEESSLTAVSPFEPGKEKGP